MLELVLGTDWTANTRLLLERLAADVAEKRGGRIMLVPELISHDMERRLCSSAGDTATLYAEVLTFTRLVRRVAEDSRCAVEECLDQGGRVVAMAAAARQLHSQLKVYASLETKPEFLTQLLDAVDEFKRCCITPADLRSASGRAEGVFAQKLEELSLLLEAYDAICQRGKRDPRDQMNWVLEKMEDGDFAQRNVFYIDGFPDYTRQHMAILEHLIRFSPNVIVSLNCDVPSSKQLAFDKAGQTAAQLIRLARNAGVEVKITTVTPEQNPLNTVRQYLFQGKITCQSELSGVLHIKKTDSPYLESQAAAQEILQLVRNGCRYRDISLVCTDMQSYRPVIGMVFRQHGIPVYLSGTDEVLHKGAITTVLLGLEAALGGFDQQAMLRYLRSAMSPISQHKCDLLENYVHIWGITGRRWLEPWTSHPEGLGAKWTDWNRTLLEELNQTRQLVTVPLEALEEGFKRAVCLADQVKALYGFLDDIGFARRLGYQAKLLDETGDHRGAQILNQLWEILLQAMEQMHDVLGNTAWDGEAFQRLFVLLLSQYDVGTIPTVLDSVTAGPVSAMRCQQAKHLFILGASEGLLPGYSGSAGVLTDQERDALRRMDVQLTGGALEGIQAEFAEVYGVFCGARETISVSCSGGQPSYVFRRLTELTGREEQIGKPLGDAQTDPVAAAAYLLKYDARQAAQELQISEQYEQVMKQRDHTLGKVSSENIHKLYGDCLNLSASQVDRQADCRMLYFLRHGIRAKEIKEATVDSAEYGTYVHDVLEHTAKEVMSLGGFHKVSYEQTMEIAKKHSDAYTKEHFSELESKRLEYLFGRNVMELNLVVAELWKELSAGAYEPKAFELGFGNGEQLPAIQIPSPFMKAQLIGYVDRVDTFQTAGVNFYRVVDYKTGKKDFDYCDVFNGVGLQMLLYLFALEQGADEYVGEHSTAAGVQYFPARVPYISLDGADEDDTTDRQRLWRRKGLLLNDELSIAAMDPDEQLPTLCVSRRKDGSLSGDLATREQLKQLRMYIFKVLTQMVEDISSGVVDPNPYTRGTSHNPCSFCPYGAVCHKDSVPGRRDYKAMTSQRFWEEIERAVNNGG